MCRKLIVCWHFHETKSLLVVQRQREFGWTHLPHHPFMLGTSSLHRMVVSAKARVQGGPPVSEVTVDSVEFPIEGWRFQILQEFKLDNYVNCATVCVEVMEKIFYQRWFSFQCCFEQWSCFIYQELSTIRICRYGAWKPSWINRACQNITEMDVFSVPHLWTGCRGSSFLQNS